MGLVGKEMFGLATTTAVRLGTRAALGISSSCFVITSFLLFGAAESAFTSANSSKQS